MDEEKWKSRKNVMCKRYSGRKVSQGRQNGWFKGTVRNRILDRLSRDDITISLGLRNRVVHYFLKNTRSGQIGMENRKSTE